MKEWRIAEAKASFSELIEKGSAEPQLILKRDKPVAALISIDEWETYQSLRTSQAVASTRELLAEIASIVEDEGEIEMPPRSSRPVLNMSEA